VFTTSNLKWHYILRNDSVEKLLVFSVCFLAANITAAFTKYMEELIFKEIISYFLKIKKRAATWERQPLI
jgi:hypothetical protein